MSKEIIAFGYIEIEKRKFHLILLEEVHIDNIMISNMVSSGEKNCKYFVGYKNDDYDIKPLHIMLSKATTHV